MARRRFNRVFRAATGMLAAAAAAVTTTSGALSSPAVSSPVLSSPIFSSAVFAPDAPPMATPLASPVAQVRATDCTLDVVAHEDDDLLFINPSVSQDIADGRCVVTLFVTAGDSGRPPSYWLRREQGSMAAYAAMSGISQSWNADTVVLAGHPILRQRLAGTRITLLFLRLPDAHGSPGRPFGTLEALWEGTVRSLRPLSGGGTYTKQSLITTLTAAMAAYQPDRIRTLDYAGRYGDGDHADHHTVGFLTYAAQRKYPARHRIVGYRGYTVSNFPDNLDESSADQKLNYFLAYAPYDSKVCQEADTCLTNFYAPRFTHSLTTATN